MTTDREKILEDALAQFIKPFKKIPFEVVVKALCDVSVLEFDKTDHANMALLETISVSMQNAAKAVQAKPIERPRPNEVGNDIEPFVVRALNDAGLKAQPPKTRLGKGKSTGYPDVLVETKDIALYLEVKTHAAENILTTQRSFYMSPAEDPKVTMDAHHLVVGFEVVDCGANGRLDHRGRELRDYIPVAFTIVDLFGMECDMKSEFNSDNRRMYSETRILEHHRLDIREGFDST